MRERGAGTTPPRDAGSENHNIYMDCFAGYAVRTHREVNRADRLPPGGDNPLAPTLPSTKPRRMLLFSPGPRPYPPHTPGQKARKEPNMLKRCDRCGQTYHTEDTRTRYCSEECRHAAILENKARYRARKKAKAEAGKK